MDSRVEKFGKYCFNLIAFVEVGTEIFPGVWWGQKYGSLKHLLKIMKINLCGKDEGNEYSNLLTPNDVGFVTGFILLKQFHLCQNSLEGIDIENGEEEDGRILFFFLQSNFLSCSKSENILFAFCFILQILFAFANQKWAFWLVKYFQQYMNLMDDQLYRIQPYALITIYMKTNSNIGSLRQ